MAIAGGAAGLAGMVGICQHGPTSAECIFWLWLYCDYCGVFSTFEPGSVFAGLLLPLLSLGVICADFAWYAKVVTGVFKGILLFMLLAGETFNQYQIEWRRSGPQSAEKEQ